MIRMKLAVGKNFSPLRPAGVPDTLQAHEERSEDSCGEEDGIPSVCFSGNKLGTSAEPLSLISSLHHKYPRDCSDLTAVRGDADPSHRFCEAGPADGCGRLPQLQEEGTVLRICSLSSSLCDRICFESKRADSNLSDLSFQQPPKRFTTSTRAS